MGRGDRRGGLPGSARQRPDPVEAAERARDHVACSRRAGAPARLRGHRRGARREHLSISIGFGEGSVDSDTQIATPCAGRRPGRGHHQHVAHRNTLTWPESWDAPSLRLRERRRRPRRRGQPRQRRPSSAPRDDAGRVTVAGVDRAGLASSDASAPGTLKCRAERGARRIPGRDRHALGGTSGATPIVARRRPSCAPPSRRRTRRIINRVIQTATDMGEPGPTPPTDGGSSTLRRGHRGRPARGREPRRRPRGVDPLNRRADVEASSRPRRGAPGDRRARHRGDGPRRPSGIIPTVPLLRGVGVPLAIGNSRPPSSPSRCGRSAGSSGMARAGRVVPADSRGPPPCPRSDRRR